MGNKLWDAQPMTSKESHGITWNHKVHESDFARRCKKWIRRCSSCFVFVFFVRFWISCRRLRWQQSCHRGMEVRSSILFGKQILTCSHYVWFGTPFQKVSTDMYWMLLMCTDALLTSNQLLQFWPWSCHLESLGLRLEACLSLHLPTQPRSVLWDEDYAGTRRYEGKRRCHPLVYLSLLYSAAYNFIPFPVASKPDAVLCKMSTLEAYLHILYPLHRTVHWLAKLAQVQKSYFRHKRTRALETNKPRSTDTIVFES